MMIIIETPIFTKRIKKLMDDEDYRALQIEIVCKPEAGKIIKGSGGIRKIRWGGSGRGKRGGCRVIYYWVTSRSHLLMLYVYSKKEAGDLTKDQLSVLKKVVEAELGK